jgi:vancomycin resistance protein VanJ
MLEYRQCNRPGAYGDPIAAPLFRRKELLRCLVGLTCWGYAAAVLSVAVMMWTLGDYWWAATLILYGPRWIWGLPLLALIPLALTFQWRALGPLMLASFLFIGPILGLRIPWGRLIGGAPEGLTLRIVSWNTQGRGHDQKAFARFAAQTRPDLVLLQEWPGFDGLSPFAGPGWFTYAEHGLGLASRFPIEVVEHVDPRVLEHRSFMSGFRIATPAGQILVYNLHLETPREGLQSIINGDLGGIATIRKELAIRSEHAEIADRFIGTGNTPVLVAGDFNMPDESTIFRSHWQNFGDAFNVAGCGFGWTKSTRWHGIRIDHILVGPRWQTRMCYVGPDLGSDHRPLIADVALLHDPQN